MNKLFGIQRQHFGIFVRQRDVRAEFVRSNLRDQIRMQASQARKESDLLFIAHGSDSILHHFWRLDSSKYVFLFA